MTKYQNLLKENLIPATMCDHKHKDPAHKRCIDVVARGIFTLPTALRKAKQESKRYGCRVFAKRLLTHHGTIYATVHHCLGLPADIQQFSEDAVVYLYGKRI